MSFLAIFFRLNARFKRQQGLAAVPWALRVSPNVIRTLVPAVRATLINAVFTFDSVKKATPTQKKSTLTTK